MRSTKSHTANRRSHHALAGMALVRCEHCQAMKMPHQVCRECGYYGQRKVIDLVAKLEKRKQKEKEKSSSN